MLSASRRQPHLLHVSAVDRRQTWSMNKSWRCVTLSGFLHSHIVRCWWNPISCGTHYSDPGPSKNDSAVTTDVCEDQNREVRFEVASTISDNGRCSFKDTVNKSDLASEFGDWVLLGNSRHVDWTGSCCRLTSATKIWWAISRLHQAVNIADYNHYTRFFISFHLFV